MQRISWLGHLERMEEDRMPKKIFTQELEGTRRWGRPRKRWKEEVERDLQVLGVRRWRDFVADKKNGRTLFDRPKPTVGCSANGRRLYIKDKQTLAFNFIFDSLWTGGGSSVNYLAFLGFFLFVYRWLHNPCFTNRYITEYLQRLSIDS